MCSLALLQSDMKFDWFLVRVYEGLCNRRAAMSAIASYYIVHSQRSFIYCRFSLAIQQERQKLTRLHCCLIGRRKCNTRMPAMMCSNWWKDLREALVTTN